MDGLPGLSPWDTVTDVLEPSARGDTQQCPVQSKPKKQVGHNSLFGNYDFVSPRAHISSMRPSLCVVEENEIVIKMIVEGWNSNMRHVSRIHKVDLDRLFDCTSPEKAIQVTHVNTTRQVADVFIFARGPDTVNTPSGILMTRQAHSSSPLVVFASCLDDNMTRRSGEIPNEQVKAPRRGLFVLISNDRPVAMKEDGCNAKYSSNTAWGSPVRPHLSPNTVSKEDCDTDPTSDTAWGNPMQSTSSQQDRNEGQSSSSSSWKPAYVKTLKSAHSTGRPRVSLTPAPKCPGEPSIEFQTLSKKGRHEGSHHPEHVLLNGE